MYVMNKRNNTKEEKGSGGRATTGMSLSRQRSRTAHRAGGERLGTAEL